MNRVEVECVIENDLGLHLRAAAEFVKLADRFSSDVTVSVGREAVNGKSIIALVTLAASKGTALQLVAEGEDASSAAAALAGLVGDRFGEDR